MKRPILAFSLAVFLSTTTAVFGGSVCLDYQRPLPVPASEVVPIVAGWFINQGYTVRRDEPRIGRVQLTAWNSNEIWETTIRPQSALASMVTVVHDGAAHASQTCRRLRDYIDGFLMGMGPSPVPHSEGHELAVPIAVHDKIETAVCIRTRSGLRKVQFSGFIVDPEGLVLCTAHDLTGHQRVTVTFVDGISAPGIVVRLDLHRDLALVECSVGNRAFVSLSNGRNLLGMGERVYSIGCPNNLQGTPAPGAINGPPRLVDDQPLWQVNMDIHPGSSGSPVFDAQGRLVAMVKGRYRGTTTVGFLTPLETMIAFLLNVDD